MHRNVWLIPGFLVLMLVLTGCAGGASTIRKGNENAPQGTGFSIHTLNNQHHRKYAVFVPHNYNASQRWPVIVFLHGVGEGGSDATSNLGVGLGPAVAERASTFPFIVIFPQSDSGYWNADSSAASDAIAALHEVERTYRVDEDRVYLTGLSTGGYGTWVIGAKYRSEFAGLVPMCAFSAHDAVPNLTDVPIWAFHNAGDMFVLAAGTSSMVSDINKHGGNAKYTEYGALGHNCWDRAYSEGELFQWMLNNRRAGKYVRANGLTAATPSSSARTIVPAPSAQSIQNFSDTPTPARAAAETPRKQPPASAMPVW